MKVTISMLTTGLKENENVVCKYASSHIFALNLLMLI